MASPTKQIKVSPEYAAWLEAKQRAINTNLNLNLGIPDITRILLQSEREPNLLIGVRRRPGRGGSEAVFK